MTVDGQHAAVTAPQIESGRSARRRRGRRMGDVLARMYSDPIGRIGGPLSMRVWLQPTMAGRWRAQ